MLISRALYRLSYASGILLFCSGFQHTDVLPLLQVVAGVTGKKQG